METNKAKIIDPEAKKSDDLYFALREALSSKDFVMGAPAFITALAKFLSDMSDITEDYGMSKEKFMRILGLTVKKVDMMKDSQNN